MRKGQYIVIKVADIQKRINLLKQFEKTKDMAGGFEELLTNPKDLYDVVEEVYTAGYEDAEKLQYTTEQTGMENFLNNLEI